MQDYGKCIRGLRTIIFNNFTVEIWLGRKTVRCTGYHGCYFHEGK